MRPVCMNSQSAVAHLKRQNAVALLKHQRRSCLLGRQRRGCSFGRGGTFEAPKARNSSTQGRACETLGTGIDKSCALKRDNLRRCAACIAFHPMPQSLALLAVHLVFSTKNREPLIDDSIQSQLHAYIVGVLKGLDCVPIQIGGVSDHVHLLFGLSRTRTIADVTREIKTSSTNWLRAQNSRYSQFHWQSGYAVFSVSASMISEVKNYIQHQAEHHHKTTFQEEYRAFLKKHGVGFDERYVWD